MRLLVALIVVVAILVLFNLPALQQWGVRGQEAPKGTSPQPARQVAGGGGGGGGSFAP